MSESKPSLTAFDETRDTLPTSAIYDAESYVRGLPIEESLQRRILITFGCEDSKYLPKVPEAGRVLIENGQRVQLMHNGVKVIEGGYYGRWMTELITLLKGHHEPQEEKAFHEVLSYLRPGAHMVEFGAFWSYYSLWFARMKPGGRTVAVEPDPNNIKVGLRNFALNGATPEFHQYSAGRTSRAPEMFPCESDQVRRLIASICVDDLIERTKLPRIDLLLADIQGAELAMLEGAARSIERGLIRFVFVATHHHSISGDPLIHQKCVQFIRERGGYILVEHTVAEGYSGDGLIVASFDSADRSLPSIHLSRNHSRNGLWREWEYDLGEAYAVIDEVGRTLLKLADRDPRLAETLDLLRKNNGVLGSRWPGCARLRSA